MGSTRSARNAGQAAATPAVAAKAPIAPSHAAGSQALIPNKNPRSSGASQKAKAAPIASPMPSSAAA